MEKPSLISPTKPRAATNFKLRTLPHDAKSFRKVADEVHGSIDIDPLMCELIDTPQFQRLRDIKQLGTTYLIYPSGNHSRFEHSIGVANLARSMANSIRMRQPNLKTTPKDVLCVTLAGLLHDIGHGPFSHVFEHFRESLKEDIKTNPELARQYARFDPVPDDWSHERSSLFMIDAALEELGVAIDFDHLDEPLKQIGPGVAATSMGVLSFRSEKYDATLTSRDWVFIKECIYGQPIPEVERRYGKKFIGREEKHKEWLYDVVSNRFTGIDVDKIDYFARDQRRTMAEAGKINVSMVEDAVIAKAECSKKNCFRCTSGDSHYMIAYPSKFIKRIREFYQFRNNMHETVYQHKTVNATACMVVDLLKKADLHYLVPIGEKRVPISHAVTDKVAFLALRDNVVTFIEHSTSEELKEARELAQRLANRKLYKFSGELAIEPNKPEHEDFWERVNKDSLAIAKGILAIPGSHDNDIVLNLDDVLVTTAFWHHGMKKKDPVSCVRFVDGDIPTWGCLLENTVPTARPYASEEYQTSIARCFHQSCVRVFCRDTSKEKQDLLQHKFFQYLSSMNLVESLNDNVARGSLSQQVAAAQTLEQVEDSSSEANDSDSVNGPIQLTQDEEFESPPAEKAYSTPSRSKRRRVDRSAIPIPSFRID